MDKKQKKDSENRNIKSEQEKDRRAQPDKKGQKQNQQLTKEDLPDSTNESRGNMGSGQRQDSN
ncbi:MAG TPA: hypothetical protein VKA49_08085 [Flavitalea sp.]|nr:hypothetical protein [Flavitalea sp.]